MGSSSAISKFACGVSRISGTFFARLSASSQPNGSFPIVAVADEHVPILVRAERALAVVQVEERRRRSRRLLELIEDLRERRARDA